MSDASSAAAPAPVESAEDFLGLVRASGLVAASRFAAVEAAVDFWRSSPGPMPDACLQALVENRCLTDWQIKMLLKRSGRDEFFLDKFKLLKPLGQGGMGSVFLAEHTTLNMSRVAIKRLPKALEAKGQYLKRFNQENWVAARLNHPNIARAWDDFGDTSDETPYHFFVMDYIQGADLDRLVRKKGPLKLELALDFIRQAALGLQYAHDEGFVHRDIKPANLMVDAKGRIKILDFGLVQMNVDDTYSKALKTDERKKSLGTPDYISPEQAEANPADRRSDIYSLGCTLYFLLTGRAPFDTVMGKPGDKNGTREARMDAHRHKRAPSVREKRADVPDEIVALVERMMAKSPEARPQSAQEVVVALERFLPAKAASSSAADSTISGSRSAMTSALSGIRSAATSSTGSSEAGEEPRAATSRPAQSAVHKKPHPTDTPPPSSAARSTARMPAAVGSGGPSGGNRGVPARGSAGRGGTATTGSRTASTSQSGGRTAAGAPKEADSTGWLFHTVAGLPVIGWLAVALVVTAVVLAAVIIAKASKSPATAAPGDAQRPRPWIIRA